MPSYMPPLRDMQFVLHEVLNVTDDFKHMPKHAEIDADTIAAVLEEGGKFAEPVQLVLNAEVAEITESSGMLAEQSPRVQVLVPVESVAAILDAVASKDALSLVLQRSLENE